jgi:hypothetical protein
MTAPVVTSFLPTVGHTGGSTICEVRLASGTGFSLPPDPPTVGPDGIVPPPLPTVSVTFGGVPALDVAVQSPTLLYALSPISPTYTADPKKPAGRDWGPGFVDVVVTNLDAEGHPIAGESVTIAQAFEYRRPDLSQESHATTTIGRFMEELARQVCPTVDYARHTDWTDGGATVDLGTIAKMPALLIVDLSFEDSVQRPMGPQAVSYGDGHWARVREPDAVDAIGTMLGVAEDVVEIQNMMVGTRKFFKKGPILQVPRTSNVLPGLLANGAYDQSGGTVGYTIEFQITDPVKLTTQGASNSPLKTFAFAFAIRGILLEDWPGVVEQGVSDTPAGVAHESTIGITSTADNGVELATEAKAANPTNWRGW